MKKARPVRQLTTSGGTAERLSIHIDRRDLATILASLRFHRDENLQGGGKIPDLVIRNIASDGGKLIPLNFDEASQLSARIEGRVATRHGECHGGVISSDADGLLIGRPPVEKGAERLFRIVYVIDINAKGARQAAESAHQIMADPQSLPPVLHVIDPAGAAVAVDLSAK